MWTSPKKSAVEREEHLTRRLGPCRLCIPATVSDMYVRTKWVTWLFHGERSGPVFFSYDESNACGTVVVVGGVRFTSWDGQGLARFVRFSPERWEEEL